MLEKKTGGYLATMHRSEADVCSTLLETTAAKKPQKGGAVAEWFKALI